MSTRSRIGMLMPSGKVKSIYCHSDGYLSYNGAMLREHYTDAKKIRALLALGDISCLYPNLAPPPGVEHRFDYEKRAPDVVVAYGRDRGEKDVSARIHDDIEAWLAAGEEYAYLWDNGKWHVWCLHEDSPIQGGELTVEMIAEALTE